MRKTRTQGRGGAPPALLLVALGFGASFASPLVFPELSTIRVFAAEAAPLSDAELFAVPPEGESVAFYKERWEALHGKIIRARLDEGPEAEALAREKSREARVAVLSVLIDEAKVGSDARNGYLTSYFSAKFAETLDVDGLEAYIAAEKAKPLLDEQRVRFAESALHYLYLDAAPTRYSSATELFELGDRTAAFKLKNGSANRYFDVGYAKRRVEIPDGETSGYYRRAYLELRQTLVQIWDYPLTRPLFNSAYRAIFRNLADAADLPESDRAEYFKRYAATHSADSESAVDRAVLERLKV